MPPTLEPPYTADRDLYLNRSGGVVEATDPTRLSLLVRTGGTLPAARARELGLIPPEATAPAERGLLSPENRRRAELVGRVLALAAELAGFAASRDAGEPSDEDLEGLAGALQERLDREATFAPGAAAEVTDPGPPLEPEAEAEVEPERTSRKHRGK